MENMIYNCLAFYILIKSIFLIIDIIIMIIVTCKKEKKKPMTEEEIKHQMWLESQENLRKILSNKPTVNQQNNTNYKPILAQSKTVTNIPIFNPIKNTPELNYYPYERKNLLTHHEFYFYRQLKEITNKYNLQILTKIRLADLVDVKKGLNKHEWGKYFGKIKSKHVDFIIADDMKVLLIIELDDYTHDRADRQERDIFVNAVLKKCGYQIIHTRGNLEQIEKALSNMYAFRSKNGAD